MELTTERGTHVEVTGEGPPLLLMHSFWCDSSMWRSQIASWSKDYQVVTMDFRGHGKSAPSKGAYVIDDLVQDAFGVLDALNYKTAVWIGLSIGGMVAQRAALANSKRVQALVLIDTDAEAFPLALRMRYRMLSVIARVAGLKPFIETVTRAMFGETSFQQRQELVDEWRERFASADRRSILHMLRALIKRKSILDQLALIHCPAFVISGIEDRSIPLAHSRRMTERLGQASILELTEAGHLCCIERPDAVSEAVLEFLDGIAELKAAKSLSVNQLAAILK